MNLTGYMKKDTGTKKLNKQVKTIDVVLIRHAQSQWNAENRFTGWANPPLTQTGLEEARCAALLLKDHGYHFDVAYSSRLLRAQQTLDEILNILSQEKIPQFQDWRLNERHYGLLQGVSKTEKAKEVGEHQVWRWRRGYLDKAEPLPRDKLTHPIYDELYRDIDPALLPNVENLAETRTRVMQFWQQRIEPLIRLKERILISSHGNTLRALIMGLSRLSIAEVESFEIPTGKPIIYTFNQKAEALHWRYLEDHRNQIAMF